MNYDFSACGITNCANCVKDGDATKCTKCADTYSLQAGKCESELLVTCHSLKIKIRNSSD